MKSIPEERQTLLFSATMPPQIKKLTKKYLKDDAQHIAIARKEMTGSTITQNFFEVNGSQRLEALCRLIDLDNPSAGIIFCRTKKGVDDLVAAMQARGYMVEGMHGDMSQNHRLQTLRKFKEGSLDFLVATDVAARGIDVDDVEAEEGTITVYTAPTDLHKAIVALRESGIEEFQVTELEMIPQSEVVLSGDDLATFEKLVDVLEDDEDVQKVYTNVEGF